MSAVKNLACSLQEQGLEGQSHAQGYSVETAAKRKMSPTHQRISLMNRAKEAMVDILTLNRLSVQLCSFLCLFVFFHLVLLNLQHLNL